MLQKALHTGLGFILLALMVLVPTDLLRIGLNTIWEGDALSMTMEMEMKTDFDGEDKEQSKEKQKQKNKITVNNLSIVLGLYDIGACGSHTDKETFGHPLAHYLEVSTPPPEFI